MIFQIALSLSCLSVSFNHVFVEAVSKQPYQTCVQGWEDYKQVSPSLSGTIRSVPLSFIQGAGVAVTPRS